MEKTNNLIPEDKGGEPKEGSSPFFISIPKGNIALCFESDKSTITITGIGLQNLLRDFTNKNGVITSSFLQPDKLS